MAFGGFFGGSGDDKSNSGETLPPDQISTTDIPPPPSSSTYSFGGSGNSDVKSRIQDAVTQQTALANAKYLLSKINENCFDHCVSEPGSSLSAKEQSCLSSCMEKYVDAWRTTSQAYLTRLQKEGQSMQANGMQ